MKNNRIMSIACIFVLIVLMLHRCYASEFNLTVYKRMPSLFHLDDYDLCMHEHGMYCLVYAEIQPNETSSLWKQIERISKDAKHNFRHDHLFIGVCLQRCMQQLRSLSRFQKQQLYGGKTTDMELRAYYRKVFKRDTDERLHYDRLINSCLNKDFQGNYQLKLRSNIEYCDRADEPLSYDNWDIAVCFGFFTIVILNITSSIYDLFLKLKEPRIYRNSTFYRKPLISSQMNKVLTSFSVCRNYYRLVLPNKNTKTSKDLSFFDAFRVIGIFFVILGHTLMIFMTIQIDNPEFFEQFLYRFESSILQNGSVVIQIFFVMSSFLLYVNFVEQELITTETNVKNCILIYFKVFFYRFMRLAPSLIILIMFNGSLLSRLQNGPLWRHITEAQRVFCREYWWKNLFFLNNYLLKESCAQQTWYIAADMQLFEIFLVVIIISRKYPFSTKYINSILLFSTFATPACLTYFLKLEAVYHLNPETYRYLYFRNSETFNQIYLPFYTNLGGYFFGFLCSCHYLKKRDSIEAKQYKGNWKCEGTIWLVMLPLAVIVLLSGYIFIQYDFQKPSIWLALYAGIYKNLWIIISAGFVYCMCFKVGWIGYQFCSLSVFRPLARISYQTFLWHGVVLRLIAGYFHQPIYVNSFFLFCMVILTFTLTNIIAFIVALLIEYPIAELIKLIFYPKKVTKPFDDIQTLNITNGTELQNK